MSPHRENRLPNVGLLGAGAVGSYFIWALCDHPGNHFCVIADGERGERLRRDGICINHVSYFPQVAEPHSVHDLDLLLVATKYDALYEALDDIEQIVSDQTIVMVLLNGVDSEQITAERIGMNHIIPSMMQIASQRKGNEVHFVPERTPGVFFGEPDGRMDTERICFLREFFSETSLSYHIVPNIQQEIWLKMAFNVSMNLPQAVVGCEIGAFADSDHMKCLRHILRDEVCAVAAAQGIDIREPSAIEKMEHPSIPTSKYSTLQDLEAGRHTEIEMFAGTLIRMGHEYHVPVPGCEFVYHVIKAIEEKNDGKFDYSGTMLK